MINHHGSDLESGHYTATVKSKNNTYYQFNDHMVNEISEKEVMLRSDGYLIFYELDEHHWKVLLRPLNPLNYLIQGK